jgi:hypothetical protein
MTRRSRLWLARRRSPSAAQGKTTTIVHSPPATIAPPPSGQNRSTPMANSTAQYATCLPLGMYRLRRSLCLRRDRHFVPKQTVVNQIPPQLRWYIDLE